MRRMSDIARQSCLRQAQDIFTRGPLLEIAQFRRQATVMMHEARVGAALDLISLCSELSETYRRSSRMTLADADRARLQAAVGAVPEVSNG